MPSHKNDVYQSPMKFSNYFFSKTNIYQTAHQLSHVIIPLRDAVFKFIISKLYTTDVQVLMYIYLKNNKVAESHKDKI